MSKLPTAEFNEGWEEGRHSADVEVMQLHAEIERLRAELALYKQNYARKQLTDSERRALEGK